MYQTSILKYPASSSKVQPGWSTLVLFWTQSSQLRQKYTLMFCTTCSTTQFLSFHTHLQEMHSNSSEFCFFAFPRYMVLFNCKMTLKIFTIYSVTSRFAWHPFTSFGMSFLAIITFTLFILDSFLANLFWMNKSTLTFSFTITSVIVSAFFSYSILSVISSSIF